MPSPRGRRATARIRRRGSEALSLPSEADGGDEPLVNLAVDGGGVEVEPRGYLLRCQERFIAAAR
jgi:hypothetical protein